MNDDETLVRLNDHIEVNRKFGIKEFNAALEKTLERKSEERTKVSFAPSNLGYSGQCPRYWYYAFKGTEFSYDNDPLGVVNMNNGASAGIRIAQMLDDADILIDTEVEVTNDDPPIRGYIDAIVMWQGRETVVEIKTTRNSTFNSRVNKNMVPGYQLLQLLVYMYLTEHEYGFMLTENKDTNELFVLPVKMTENNKKLVEDTLEWMRTVKKNADEGELPTRPFNKSSPQCKGCPVRDVCWEGWTRGSVNGTDPNPGTVTIPILEVPRG
jgi:CRISPR/Cas system-associated exonuclease Cas4 (RecB family)